MSIETLGEAFSLGWRLTARCASENPVLASASIGNRDAMKRVRECKCRTELDLETLVWTRGRAVPLSCCTNRRACADPRLDKNIFACSKNASPRTSSA
jgi:hypothetical protein